MLPINRLRDGRDSLAQNDAVEEEIVTALENNTSFCIFPEGTHNTKSSLLPLRKGLFRIALRANAAFGNRRPVYIVPIGISYGNYYEMLSSALCQIGEPISVTDFVALYPEVKEAEMINMLKDKLTQNLKDNILYLPEDEHYTATMELCRIHHRTQVRRLGLAGNLLEDRLYSARTTAAEIEQGLSENPEAMRALLEKTAQLYALRKKKGIRFYSIAANRSTVRLFFVLLSLLVCLPYFLFSILAHIPLIGIGGKIFSKVKDKIFLNSIHIVLQTAILPLEAVLTAVLSLIFLPLYGALGVVVLAAPSYFFYLRYLRWVRVWISDRKWKQNRSLQAQYQDLQRWAEKVIVH
jgi:hypothetical protein